MNDQNNKPLYEEDQVITYKELYAMREGCIYQYDLTHWWNYIERFKFRAAIGCINAMLVWMTHGKPIVKVLKGETK